MYFTGSRTDHTGTETDRRHESDPDGSDIRDGDGENLGRASGPRECGSPGDGCTSRVECAAVVVVTV